MHLSIPFALAIVVLTTLTGAQQPSVPEPAAHTPPPSSTPTDPATPTTTPTPKVRARHVTDPVKVLFCTASFGFKHDVLPLAREVMTLQADKLEWLELIATDSADSITGTNLLTTLAEIDVLMLYTTGTLPFDAKQLAAWVEAGGALVGVHSATDTLSDDPAYVPLIGAVFDGHPWDEEVTILAPEGDRHQPQIGFNVEYHSNPSRRTFRIADEIYQFKQLSDDRKVQFRLAPGQPKMEPGRDYPLAWTSVRGKGRVFYSALGHRPEVWNNPEFVRHVLNGLWWSAAGSGDRACKQCNVAMERLPMAYGLRTDPVDPDKFIAGGCIVGLAHEGFRCPKCKHIEIPRDD